MDRYALCVVGWSRVRARSRPLDSSIHPYSSTGSVRCYSSRAKVAMYVIHPMGGCCLLISDLSEKILSWPASQPARGQTAACQPPPGHFACTGEAKGHCVRARTRRKSLEEAREAQGELNQPKPNFSIFLEGGLPVHCGLPVSVSLHRSACHAHGIPPSAFSCFRVTRP